MSAATPTLQELQDRLDAAQAALIAAVNKRFPVGMRVTARSGRGWMIGVVRAKCMMRPDVIIEHSRTGKVHHKNWRDVQPF